MTKEEIIKAAEKFADDTWLLGTSWHEAAKKTFIAGATYMVNMVLADIARIDEAEPNDPGILEDYHNGFVDALAKVLDSIRTINTTQL